MSADGACSVMFSYDFSYENGVFAWLATAAVEKGLRGPNGPYERQYIEPTPQRNPSMPALQLPCLPDAPGIWCAPTSSYENTARFFFHSVGSLIWPRKPNSSSPSRSVA
jgi:hypothetical protein